MASLSYLDVTRLPGDVFMGGLMTVNDLGLPAEFIYSDPVKPSNLQASLYGSTLSRYLIVDVIGKGLVDASKSTGVPIVVAHSELLTLATKVKRPLCQISATHQAPLADVGEMRESATGELLVQLSEIQNPFSLRFFDRANFPVEQHLSCLIDCATRFDLLEPQGRIRRTLEMLREPQDDD